jgi:hypothetical protein
MNYTKRCAEKLPKTREEMNLENLKAMEKSLDSLEAALDREPWIAGLVAGGIVLVTLLLLWLAPR